MQKNNIVTLTCDNLGSQMEGVCRLNGMAVFVAGMLPGETGRVVMTKTLKTHAFGRLLALETTSSERQEPPCLHYRRCGGCSCLHMRYETALNQKACHIADCFRRIGGMETDIPAMAGMSHPFHYRNKMALPCRDIAGALRMGFFAPRSHDLIPIRQCLMSREPGNVLKTAAEAWFQSAGLPAYDDVSHTGLLRHMVTRVNRKGEAMVILVVNGAELPHAGELVQALKESYPNLISVWLNINDKRTNVIFGAEQRLLYGVPTMTETLCGMKLSISPQSFFQINTEQAERLFRIMMGFCAPSVGESLADVYCGAGAIALIMASKAREVLGIEADARAVADARENARLNGISNARFITGKAEEALPNAVKSGFRPDIVVLDPPRKGLEQPVIEAVAQAAPKRVVYISCSPATQARDARHFLARGYRVTRMSGVDMFCWTDSIENVLLLEPV
ncbi:MAG: 23S rRNA (uracil(1939)-C(5))-methyltransferase RlmD [Clostridia bacterium]|nr:23S rRNA (uracil(1939)-C(5))-methyltransferase RlmD [Clostridia bacterium]